MNEFLFCQRKLKNTSVIWCLLTELQSMTLELGSIEGITLTCCARPLFPFPSNVGLELGHGPPKSISKQHWKRQRQVSEQCDPSWVSSIVGRAGPESIWLSARTYIWCCPDLEPHIFPSGPPIQSISTYDVSSWCTLAMRSENSFFPSWHLRQKRAHSDGGGGVWWVAGGDVIASTRCATLQEYLGAFPLPEIRNLREREL